MRDSHAPSQPGRMWVGTYYALLTCCAKSALLEPATAAAAAASSAAELPLLFVGVVMAGSESAHRHASTQTGKHVSTPWMQAAWRGANVRTLRRVRPQQALYPSLEHGAVTATQFFASRTRAYVSSVLWLDD